MTFAYIGLAFFIVFTGFDSYADFAFLNYPYIALSAAFSIYSGFFLAKSTKENTAGGIVHDVAMKESDFPEAK